MIHKKYKSIDRLKAKFESTFQKGDKIVIQEKIDGANASILYDGEDMHAFSRRLPLDEMNHLNGFWQYSQTIKKVESLKGYRIFGEWLVKHTIIYPDECYYQFYLFDIYDDKEEKYLLQEEVVKAAKLLELPLAEVFYEGEFKDWEHALSFVGKSALAEEGEGVVLKNLDRLNDPDYRNPFYVKLVAPSFQEKKAVKVRKPIDPEALAQMEYTQSLVESIVNKARVQKQLFILVEDGVIPQNFDLDDMGVIVRRLGQMICRDCIREEPETVAEIGKLFGKYASSTAIKIAKEIIMDKEKEAFDFSEEK